MYVMSEWLGPDKEMLDRVTYITALATRDWKMEEKRYSQALLTNFTLNSAYACIQATKTL